MMLFPLKQCLEAESRYKVTVKPCKPDDPRQHWIFNVYTAKYHSLVKAAKAQPQNTAAIDRLVGKTMAPADRLYRRDLLKMILGE